MRRNSDRKYWLWLLGIGVVVRFWGITYGLPAVYNSTEYFIAKQALSLGARGTLEPLFYIYPTFYTYLIALVFGLYFGLGRLLGLFASPADFAFLFLSDPTSFYLLGRSLNALAMIAALLIFYRALRFYLAEKPAFLLSLLFFLSTNLQYFTFWMVPDAFLILGTVTVLYFLAKYQQNDLSFREFLFASLVCGLTVSTKYNAGFLAAGWVLNFLVGKPLRRRTWRFRRAGLAGIFVLLGFLLGSPYWLLKFGSFWNGFKMIWSQSRYSFGEAPSWPYLWEVRQLLVSEWGLGLLLLGLLLLGFRLRRLSEAPLAAVFLPTFLLVGTWQKKGLDYLLVIFPALLLFGGILWQRVKSRRLERLFPYFVGALLLLNGPRVLYQNFLHTRDDTRRLASRWIVEQIPAGSKLCYDHYHYDLDIIDVNRYLQYGAGSRYLSPAVKRKIRALANAPNNYRLISARKVLEEPSLPPALREKYRRDPYLWEALTHPHKTLAELQAEGVEYLIVNSQTFRTYLENEPPPPQHPLREEFRRVQTFYRGLSEHFRPLVVFKPDWKTPGPEIRIYRLTGEKP